MYEQFLDTITSKNTRSTYARGLAHFAAWASSEGVSVESLRVKHIKAYREHLQTGRAGSSVNAYLSALRSFLKWAAEGELVDPAVYQAASVVSNVAVADALPAVLRDEQVDELLAAPDAATLQGARDLAIIALLVASGLRVSEAVNLNLSDIDFSKGELRVMGKGQKERVAFFNDSARSALLNYLARRQSDAEPVFVNRSGERISARYVQERVAGYGVTLDGGERLHPHTLRHTFATAFLDASGDLDAVRRTLGHSRTETTQRYTRLATRRLRETYQRTMNNRVGSLVLEMPATERRQVEYATKEAR